MAINVTTEEHKKTPALNFPCLLAHPFFDKVQIILATDVDEKTGHFTGTNVNGIGWPAGSHSTGWDANFAPWHGSVTLQNAPKVQ
jgi:hypothetical protein